ncbi:hypothetical protein MNBD_ALPHA05-129 [hydrothermal vent metagenome]|uniref:SSD domain-containing protein n=1 Tax=hydrothermal vent metagenome TaxID=652676 RepID=A0A3B0SM97_9ZZZZ
MLKSFGVAWSRFVFERALVVLVSALVLTFIAFKFAGGISVSTRLEELMPQSAASVQTLNSVLKKTGSFASIQIVAQSDSAETTLDFLQAVKSEIDHHDWVAYSHYSENIEFLTRHKLLMLDLNQLLDLEREVEGAYPVFLARKLSEAVGTDVTYSVRSENVSGDSRTTLDQTRIDELTTSLNASPEAERFFATPDGLTAVLVVWPKPGLDKLTDAKRMVEDARQISQKLENSSGGKITSGVAGRIANKVAQFDAVTGDLKLGLISAIGLISILIGLSYRNIFAVPAIILPLAVGLVWTLGLTAAVIGSLNLITVFLVLILFGLGIDFGIHNYSRYREERRRGRCVEEAIRTVITHTGGASLAAALTTSLGFLSLTLTEFRAFSEFGFIAGVGIILIFISMYSLFPAIIAIYERRAFFETKSVRIWKRTRNATPRVKRPLSQSFALAITVVLFIFAVTFLPQISFERDFKNLEASQPPSLVWATKQVNRIFGGGHDRAIVAVKTLSELVAIDAYFRERIATEEQTPTIEKISSVLDYIPPIELQDRRLEVIRRLGKRIEGLKFIDQSLYNATKQYLAIDKLEISDLPQALQRTFVGTKGDPGYLLYIYNSVSMDDSVLAREFYDDAASFRVNGKNYAAASEGFIFVEMIALMKADAMKAISLVTLSTALLILLFTRSLKATAIILAPPILGVLVTLGIMGATGLSLSIVNMVILPSLIGISVDNTIHIFHRFDSEGSAADISQIMSSTGRAAVLTTLTTLIGFGGLVTASMGGLRSMGLLAIIGFTTCLVTTWWLLPNLLKLYRQKA